MRPRAWNGWAEVVGRDEREPRFIGDMPHAWVSSDYIRSTLDLLVYERDRDHAPVLAAGIPTAWLEGEGVGVTNVRTAYGPLTYNLRQARDGYLLTLDGQVTPPGGFVIQWPAGETPPARARIDGRAAEWSGPNWRSPPGREGSICGRALPIAIVIPGVAERRPGTQRRRRRSVQAGWFSSCARARFALSRAAGFRVCGSLREPSPGMTIAVGAISPRSPRTFAPAPGCRTWSCWRRS